MAGRQGTPLPSAKLVEQVKGEIPDFRKGSEAVIGFLRCARSNVAVERVV